MQQNVGPAFPRIRVKIVFEVESCAYRRHSLPIVRSGDFGASSLFGLRKSVAPRKPTDQHASDSVHGSPAFIRANS